jgi:hypothetical protein
MRVYRAMIACLSKERQATKQGINHDSIEKWSFINYTKGRQTCVDSRDVVLQIEIFVALLRGFV